MTAYLVDTNVLLRVVKPDDRDYSLVRSAMYQLWTTGYDLCYTSQNLAEFWNACTRPVERNGYGLSIPEVDRRARLIESQLAFVEDSRAVHQDWRKLVVECRVSGAQVHDPKNGSRPRALNGEMVTIVQHEQRSRSRSGSPGG